MLDILRTVLADEQEAEAAKVSNVGFTRTAAKRFGF
jgi:hypothetical protein